MKKVFSCYACGSQIRSRKELAVLRNLVAVHVGCIDAFNSSQPRDLRQRIPLNTPYLLLKLALIGVLLLIATVVLFPALQIGALAAILGVAYAGIGFARLLSYLCIERHLDIVDE